MLVYSNDRPSMPSAGRPRKSRSVGAMSTSAVRRPTRPGVSCGALSNRNGRVSSGPQPPCWPQPITGRLPSSVTVQRRPAHAVVVGLGAARHVHRGHDAAARRETQSVELFADDDLIDPRLVSAGGRARRAERRPRFGCRVEQRPPSPAPPRRRRPPRLRCARPCRASQSSTSTPSPIVSWPWSEPTASRISRSAAPQAPRPSRQRRRRRHRRRAGPRDAAASRAARHAACGRDR